MITQTGFDYTPTFGFTAHIYTFIFISKQKLNKSSGSLEVAVKVTKPNDSRQNFEWHLACKASWRF